MKKNLEITIFLFLEMFLFYFLPKLKRADLTLIVFITLYYLYLIVSAYNPQYLV